MALVLIKEDGSGKADANSYADVAGADAYFEGHLYATAWTGATAQSKGAALVMATRLIDSQYQFNGFRAHSGQALQWPRERCPDPDGGGEDGGSRIEDGFVPVDVVPALVMQAACEMARELLIADRTTAPAGEGLSMEHTSHYQRDATGNSTSDSATTQYNKSDTRPIISQVAQAMLSKYGALVSARSGVARLVRG